MSVLLTEGVLHAHQLTKRYGALLACDHVSLSLRRGEVHALIGPNGAGKSTLIHLLSGSATPDSGQLMLNDQDITRLGLHQRVIAGVSRSYQITNIFKQLTVFENLLLAVQACCGTSFSFWRPRAREEELVSAAEQLAKNCAIGVGVWAVVAGSLPHGEQRKLEFALAMASKPAVLLLDEPMAGMGPDETLKLTELIASLRGQTTILLVEHDMQAVFRLADRLSVLVYGRVIATGTPEEIRQHAGVREAYLGEENV